MNAIQELAPPVRTTFAADEDLRDRVRLFFQQKQVGGSRLTIEAQRGVVTLRGTVPTFHQRQILYSLARRVAGAVHVVDELEVDIPPRQPAPVTALAI